MNENFYIQIFEGKQVRIVWDAEKEKCLTITLHFSV
jgi:hypothetical protein